MKVEAVTTFNAAGYAKYGKRMVETFAQYWQFDTRLIVYYEGCEPPAMPVGGEVYRDLNTSSPWLLDFKARNQSRNINIGYRHDAIRFSHKVAALHCADKASTASFLVWLDGDIVTHSAVTEDTFARHLAPAESEWIARLDRTRMHMEAGFFVLNRLHPRHKELMAEYERLYTTDALFLMKEWHDSYLLQRVIEDCHAPAKSLSGQWGKHTGHPLVNGPLGAWFDHLKGMRKDKGRSLQSDIMTIRSEPYWRQGVK